MAWDDEVDAEFELAMRLAEAEEMRDRAIGRAADADAAWHSALRRVRFWRLAWLVTAGVAVWG